jgi:hypothetical protein
MVLKIGINRVGVVRNRPIQSGNTNSDKENDDKSSTYSTESQYIKLDDSATRKTSQIG